ncbi:MAG: hypothetical protein L0I74_09230, partial [Tetragenococcus halophilus]|nr:hypothetical protein [Tetragenococcus halophilus]
KHGQQFRKILSENPNMEREMEKFYLKNKDITFILLTQELLNDLFSVFVQCLAFSLEDFIR